MGAEETLKIVVQWQDRGVSRGAQETNRHLDAMGRRASGLTNTFGRLGPAIGAVFSIEVIRRIGQTSVELAQLSARAGAMEAAFERLAQQEGLDPERLSRSIREASRNALTQMDTLQIGNRVLLSEVDVLTQRLPELVSSVRVLAIAQGIDLRDAIKSVTDGIIKMESELIDNIGINAKIEMATRRYAESLGVAASALTEQQKQTAFANLVLDEAKKRADSLGDSTNELAQNTSALSASWEKLKVTLGTGVQGEVNALTVGLAAAIDLISDLLEKNNEINRQIEKRANSRQPGPVESFFSNFFTTGTLGKTLETIADIRRHSNLEIILNTTFNETDERELPTLIRDLISDEPIEYVVTIEPRLSPAALAEVNEALEQIHVNPQVIEQMVDDIRAVVLREGGLSPMTGEIPFDLRNLIDDGRGGERQGLPTPSRRGLKDRLRDELGRSVDDLDLFADALSRLHPELGSVVGTVNVGVQSLDVFTSATSLLGKAAGAIGVGGALFSLADSIFGWSRKAQERAQRNAELAREQARTQQELNQEIKDAISLTGRFANEISGQTDQELRNAFSRNVSILGQYLDTAGLSIENALSRENDLRLQLERKNFDERFDFLDLALNQNITIAKTYSQRITDAKLDLRREQGEIIIDAIERQRRDVLQAQENALEAARQAAIRATRLQFDFREAELRARYLPQFQATQSGAGREVLLGQVSRDIEGLRRGESAALEQALNALIEPHRQRIDQVNTYYDGLTQAVRDAIPDLSQPFLSAIHEQTSAFLEAFRAGEVSDPLADLPQDLREFTTGFLEGAEAEILARVDGIDLSVSLPPIDLPPITPPAEDVKIGDGGISIDIPPLDPKVEDIVASVININFPELAPDTEGVTLSTIHLNFPALGPEISGVTLSTIHLNFPALGPEISGVTLSTIHLNFPHLSPGIEQISVGGVSVELPHLSLAWPPLPRWVWPPLPRLQIDVSGNITTTQRVVQESQPTSTGTPTYNPGDFNRPSDPFVDDGDFDTEEDEIDHIVRSLGENSGIREAIERLVRGGG